jgi:hypothetical protein
VFARVRSEIWAHEASNKTTPMRYILERGKERVFSPHYAWITIAEFSDLESALKAADTYRIFKRGQTLRIVQHIRTI